MSSSLLPEGAQAARPSESTRWSPGTWSLRSRLLIGLVALLALVCLLIGAATELALRQYLVNQLDQTLQDTSRRSAMMSAMPPPPPDPEGRHWRHPGPGPEFLDAPGQPIGLVALVLGPGQTSAAGVLTSAAERGAVTAGAAEQLGHIEPLAPATSTDLDGLGRYRVVATYDRHGNVVITGIPLSDVDDTMLRVLLIMAVVAAVALALASTLGAVIIRQALAPLTRVAATARRVANLPLDRGEVALPVRVSERDANPNTEVGQMGSALNRMLDHISTALSTRQASETRVRQFVADASHELRTPLAAIRGYTELAQRRRTEVPDEVAHAMGRVSSEADRMTQLVEDLLLLARLDSGRPLERGEVDLSQLAVDALSDAHIAGPDHDWNLDLPDEPVVVDGDGARLHQVLTNLLTNARVHTPPDTAVTLSLTSDGQFAHIQVSDNGPGIPADLQSEVFERFARGDTSRSRHRGSTGLGLAIVAAVVKAHHGRIVVRSVPGDTVFTVTLPLTGGT